MTTATITRNHSSSEIAPCMFLLDAWSSSVTAGVISKAACKWVVSGGGNQNAGTYFGHNLGLFFDEAGSYTAVLTLTDEAGTQSTASTTLVVTVAPTYDDEVYVSGSGNDTTGDGTIGTPWASLNKAITELDANKASSRERMIRVEAGTTSTLTNTTTVLLVTGYVGSLSIDRYGVGADPIIAGTTSDNNGIEFRNGLSGVACRFRLRNLKFVNTSVSSPLGFTTYLNAANPRGHDVILWGVESDVPDGGGVAIGIGSPSGQVPTADADGMIQYMGNVGLKSCTLLSGGYTLYADVTRFAMQDCTLSAANGPGGLGATHVARFSSCHDLDIRRCTFERCNLNRYLIKWHHDPYGQSGTYASVGFSGEGSIVGNTFVGCSSQLVELAPQDQLPSSLPETVSRVVVLHNNVYEDATFPRRGSFLGIAGSELTIVGNRIRDRHIAVAYDYQDEKCTDVLIANNSVYRSDMIAYNDDPTIVSLDVSSGGAIEFQNNAAISTVTDVGIVIVDGTGSVDSDYNVASGLGWFGKYNGAFKTTLATWRTDTGLDANSATTDPAFTDAANGDFTIGGASPCFETGATVQAARYDYLGTIRGTWDIGAHQAGATGTDSSGGPPVNDSVSVQITGVYSDARFSVGSASSVLLLGSDIGDVDVQLSYSADVDPSVSDENAWSDVGGLMSIRGGQQIAIPLNEALKIDNSFVRVRVYARRAVSVNINVV